MRRQRIDLDAVASRDNLIKAAYAAGVGKRSRPEVRQFFNALETEVQDLHQRILSLNVPCVAYRSFRIRDPKPRLIHAPSFRDRVIHHALMNHIGQRLDTTLVDSSYACRRGKGALAAVHAAQSASARHPWYVQIDIAGYFDHVNHARLKFLLAQRLKGAEGLELINRFINSYHVTPGNGLPIGTLTSQCFANFYLDGVDRFIRETIRAQDHIRYMDDIVWWCKTRAEARYQLNQVAMFIQHERLLTLKPQSVIQRSDKGLRFCGYRILPHQLRLTTRRKKSYKTRRQYWEQAWLRGACTDLELQQAYAGVHGIVSQADSLSWRKQQLSLSVTPEL